MENLEFYNKYKEVPKEALKEFDNGKFKGTDINTMWRIKCLTEHFGMVGFGWYFNITNKWSETLTNGDVFVFAEIELFVKVGNEWSKGIVGTGGNKLAKITSKGTLSTSDEAYKMAVTDALGVACRSLGMGADVYWANDKTKYTSENQEREVVGGAYILKGGKYDGKSIDEVLEIDEQYIKWCIINAKNEFVKLNMVKAWDDSNREPIEVEV